MRAFLVVIAVCTMLSPAVAATVWDEVRQGDLADDAEAPSVVPLEPGVNRLTATTIGFPLDRDFFRVELPAGEALVRLELARYDYTGLARDQGAFLGVERGPVFSDTTSGAAMLGGTLIGELAGRRVGDDLLPALAGRATPHWGPGFTPPLTADEYTFWYQQTVGDTAYALDFVVTPVPPALPALATGLATLALLRRHPAWWSVPNAR